MEAEIASTVTATSVMLAAYGFFYGALKDRIAAGFAVGLAEEGEGRAGQKAAVTAARNTAFGLGIVPLVIWLIFLKATVEQIEAGLDVNFSISHYSPLDIVFVLLANSWLLIAVILLVQAIELTGKRKKYE